MAESVEEHPVLIPTSQGPAGGIVCEPAGPARAAAIFLQGGGRAGRSGFNSEWARLARRLAGLGTTVLRFDFCTDGDSLTIGEEHYPVDSAVATKLAVDTVLIQEVVGWYRQRTGRRDLIAVGTCYGTRLGLELAKSDSGLAASLMIVPYFRRNTDEDRARWRRRMLTVRRGESTEQFDHDDLGPSEKLDRTAIEGLESALAGGPVWVLIGERDADDPVVLAQILGDRGLEVDVVPDIALYPGNDPDVQELVSDRVVARVSRLLDRGQ